MPTYDVTAAMAKTELVHKIMDNNDRSKSARSKFKIGSLHFDEDGRRVKVIDKVIYFVNECPHCSSHATFHHRMQLNGDFPHNVWATKKFFVDAGVISIKFDYCLDCHRDFMMEMYVFEVVKKK